jgi:hypothetical protein
MLYVGLEVLRAVSVSCLHACIVSLYSSTLKLETIYSPESSVVTHWTTRGYTLGDSTIQNAYMLQKFPGVNFLFSLNLTVKFLKAIPVTGREGP